MNHVWPTRAAFENLRSFNGRKVTDSRSLSPMDSRSGAHDEGESSLVVSFSCQLWRKERVLGEDGNGVWRI